MNTVMRRLPKDFQPNHKTPLCLCVERPGLVPSLYRETWDLAKV